MAWEQPKFSELVYETRLVAFVDILGWRDAIATKPPGDLGWLIGLLQHIEQNAPAGADFAKRLPLEVVSVPHGLEVSQFSDSIVISVPADAPSARWTLEGHLHWLCMMAAQSGFLLRGGVVRGLLFHRSRMLYGPALVQAYDLESKVAIYPRIVLDEPLEPEFYPGPQLSDENGVYGHGKAWRRDEDGRVFFDFMQPFNAMEVYPESGRPPWRPNIHLFEQYRSVVAKGVISSATNPHVAAKYEWARRCYKAVIAEYPMLHLQPLVLEIDGQLFAFDDIPEVKAS